MREREVPQDVARAYEGQRKALYAVNDRGQYEVVKSAGWEAEEIVLDQAIAEFERLAADAWRRCRDGLTSPLEYHMFRRRMDRTVLAQATGHFRWVVGRHFQPRNFQALSAASLAEYADALGMTVPELRSLPDSP